MGLQISPSVIKDAAKIGLQLVTVGDRVEVRQGSRVISFNVDPALALRKAVERLEEKRLRELDPRPEDREPVLHIPRRTRAAATVAPVAPPMPDPPPLPPIPDYTEAAKITAGEVITKSVNSIIKSKYKDRYKAKGGNCGDEIAEELTEYLVVLKGGKARVDEVKLEAVARTNGIWRDTYAVLNVGQRRMTIGNRLRARYAEGLQVDIGGMILIDPACIEK